MPIVHGSGMRGSCHGNSIITATGYSFPSGHTMNAATVFGGGAVRKDLPGLLRMVLGITVVLVAFSRIYLGVHCPQDILVGAAAGILVMWLTAKLMQWVAARPEKDIIVLCIGIGLAIAVAIYAAVKPYPADYDAEGRLLVDGVKMANDTFKGVGWCSAFLIGWVLERRFVGFSTDVPVITRVSRTAEGLLGYYIVSLSTGFIVNCHGSVTASAKGVKANIGKPLPFDFGRGFSICLKRS